MATRVLDHRSVSYHWRLNAHRGAVNCLWVRVVPETNLQRVYTGGEDGALRVWDHKGNVAMEMTGHTAPIHAIFFANGKIYTGDDEGWICVWNERESRRILKWRAHEPTEESSRCRITKIQVVSEGRVFTGSWDGTVRLWDPHEESDDIPLQREFPPPAQAHNDPVETFQVVKGNLLFTAHRGGCIRIWNMQEDLLKVIRARGVTARFRCMQVSTTHLSDNCTKVNIYVGVENRIFLFEIKRRRIVMDGDPDCDNWEFDIDRVRSLEKLSGVTTDVLSIWVVYEDAMQTDEPAMYVGGADGNAYLTIPTDKAVYVDLGSRAMRFKNYTFKGQGGGATCIAVSGGKVFTGNSGGGLTCFKEPYNMEKLRYYSRTVKPYNTTKNLAPIGPRPVRATTTITTTTTRSSSSSAGGSPASFNRTTTSSSSSSGSSYPDSLSSSGKDLQFPDISSLRIKEEPSYPVQQVQPQFMSYSSVPGAIPSANPALASFAAATNPANLQSLNSGLQFQQLPNGQFVLADPNAFALQQQQQQLQQQQQQQQALNSLSMPQAGAGGFSFPSLSDPSGASAASQPGAFNPALFSLSNPALASQFSMPMGSFGSGLDQGQGQGQGQMDPLQQQLLQQQLLQQQLQLQQQQLQQQMQLQQQQLQQPQFLTLPDGTQVPIASFQQNPMGLQSLPAGVPVSAASLGLSSLPQTGSMPGSSAAPPAASGGGGAEKKEPCCICYDAPRNALIYPCGHACICYNCSRELLKQTKRICPLCRKNIRDIVKIFD